LFYMNGCCIQKVGSDGYDSIVKRLKATGFKVEFKLRDEDNDEAVMGSVNAVVARVKALIASGTSPEDITVSGYSLGSIIAMYASYEIANPKINYVLLAGCPGPKARRSVDYSKVQGRVLSVIDVEDDKFGSCAGKLANVASFKEVALKSGKGHMMFRLPDDDYLKLWKEPLVNWANGK